MARAVPFLRDIVARLAASIDAFLRSNASIGSTSCAPGRVLDVRHAASTVDPPVAASSASRRSYCALTSSCALARCSIRSAVVDGFSQSLGPLGSGPLAYVPGAGSTGGMGVSSYSIGGGGGFSSLCAKPSWYLFSLVIISVTGSW